MKRQVVIFWILIIIGTLGVASSIYSFLNGDDFNTYFWGGFSGVSLIGLALANRKKI